MSEQGICSRREADNYIEQGLVLVDGEVVSELGARAFPNQKIELKKAAIAQQARRYTIILNKPVGYISHFDEDREYKPAASLITPENQFVHQLSANLPGKFNTRGLA
ncbi:MAG: hypothetical protein RL183_516, partial [Pseudomonadota bacterium]